jgi:hypothetical protein
MHNPRQRKGKALKQLLIPPATSSYTAMTASITTYATGAAPDVQSAEAPRVTADAKVAVVANEHLAKTLVLYFD